MPWARSGELGVGRLGVVERFADQGLALFRVLAPQRPVGELQQDHRLDQSLLRAVVDLADDAASLGVRRLDYSRAGGTHLLHADALVLPAVWAAPPAASVARRPQRQARAVGDDGGDQ